MGMTLKSMGSEMFESHRDELTYSICVPNLTRVGDDDANADGSLSNDKADKENEKHEIRIEVDRGDNVIVQKTASDVFADLMRYVRETVIEKELDDGDPTAQGANKYALVVFTYPAFYSAEQKRATRRTAIRAGFPSDKIRMISEPEAAALLFCNTWQGTESGPILVYDMGGGTFDLAIVEATF